MYLPDWLARRALLHPERPALITPELTWSFAELQTHATWVVQALASLGVARGARVALLARNGLAYVAALHAAPRAGVLLVPLNTRLTPAELAWQLADCDASLLLYDEAHTTLATRLTALPRMPLEALLASPAPNAQPLSPTSLNLDEPHSIIYTSGTTGRPKGAVLTLANHWWSATASMLNLGLNEHDRWLAVLPLFHVGGLAILLRGAIYGMPVVLHERFEPALTLAAIDHDGVTIVSLVAVMLQRMIEQRGDVPLPAHFRCALLGGGPVPAPLLATCTARGLPVLQTYGMTETASQVVTLAPGEALRRPGSAGQPLLPAEVRIMVDERLAAPGEVGEICVRGPMVMAGYYGQPAATAAAIRDGWLATGDLGLLDAEGYLFVVDRRSDLIISGGENVYPAEVEAVLLAHPAVAEAGVIGLPDPSWGQVPVAFVVPVAGATPDSEELIAHCRNQLAAYKTPRRISLLAALPRTAAGKLRRAALRELAAQTDA